MLRDLVQVALERVVITLDEQLDRHFQCIIVVVQFVVKTTFELCVNILAVCVHGFYYD